MSKQTADNKKYRVYYGVDDNAALQPQYIEEEEEQKQQRQQERIASRRAAKIARKMEVRRYAALSILTVAVAAMGFFVVSRNAQIYNNNMQIRKLASDRENLEILSNTAEKDGAGKVDVNGFFDVALNQLSMDYPSEEQVVTVVLPAVTDTQEPGTASAEVSVYDTVLDWLSSLNRRIRNWA